MMKGHTDKQLLRVLLVAVVLLALGEGYIIIALNAKAVAAHTSDQSATTAISANVAPAAQTVPTSLGRVTGVVSSVGGGSLVIKSQSGSPTTITVSSSATTILKQGALLDQATQDANMQKFHAYAEELMQDPQKNQYALAHLIAPAPYQTTTIKLSDIAPGDTVLVFGDPQSDGSYVATQIVDTPGSAQ